MLSLLALNLQAQECRSLQSRFMGYPRVDVALEQMDVVTLPIVFHIMHAGDALGTGANIPDAHVLSAVEAVNNHFRAIPGTDGDGEGVDTKIEFCLAQRYPDGVPSSGITRHDLSFIPGFAEDGVAVSGLDDGANDLQVKQQGCWNLDDYVNVYVVPEINGNNGFGGIQGYAYTGPTGNCLDGIVILASRVNVTPTNLGKTLTHELGHYLSLQHTFYNTLSCGSESNCATQGDMVCDTPPTTTNFSCNSPSCPDAMTSNYMDYTGQVCRNAYTQGQAEKMHHLLMTSRSELPYSIGCVAPVDYDLALVDVQYTTPFCNPQQDVIVTIAVQGTQDISAASVAVVSNGVYYNEDLYDLVSGQQYAVTIENVPLDGAFGVEVLTVLDQYPENNETVGFVNYAPGAVWQMHFTTDFFASETSWTLEGPDGVVIEADNYFTGINEYQYQTCLYDGCYTLTIYDDGGDGMPYGGAIAVSVDGVDYPVNIDGDWDALTLEFCVSTSQCPYDLDGNGTVGNGDLLLLLSEYGCQVGCAADVNGDGAVDVNDLLAFLNVWGQPCGQEQPNNLQQRAMPLEEQIYDLSGRRVYRPLDDLPTGFYIVAGPEGIRKIYKQ